MVKHFRLWGIFIVFGLLMSLVSPSATAVFALDKPVHNTRSNTYYDTLHEALADTNLADGDTIAIEGDVAETHYSVITKNISVVAGNGSYKITGSASTGQQETNSLFIVKNGGSLTLGDGNANNILTVSNGATVVYSKGTTTLKDGAAVVSDSNNPIWVTGEGSSFVGKGGSSTSNNHSSNSATGLRLDVDSSSTISGGTYTGDYAGVFVTGHIDEISGGSFIGVGRGLLLQKNTGNGSEEDATGPGTIGTISGGFFQGGTDGLTLQYRGTIDKITGGTFTNPSTNDYAYATGLHMYSDNSYATKPRINSISGGKFSGVSSNSSPYSIGLWITQGNISEISGGEFSGTVAVHMDKDKSAVIGTISNGTFSGTKNGIANGAEIDYITGGSFIGGTSSGVVNNYSTAVMQTISGGYFEGGNYGFTNAGTMTSITGGTFYGKKVNAIRLLGTDTVDIEPGLTDPDGYIDFRTNDNTSVEEDPIFTGEDLAVFPEGYHMSLSQRDGANDLQYRYLTKYTLTFDTQGGESIESKTITDASAADPASGLFAAKAGSEFVKWQYKDESGTLKDYASTMSFTDIANGADTATLYAVWKENTYTVQFDTNGGSAVDDQSAKYADSDLVKNADTAKEGYTLTGWQYKDADGNLVDYDSSKKLSDIISEGSSSVRLYAKWTANSYSIMFDNNTGLGSMENQKMTYDTETKISKNVFTKVGYTFVGWNTKADGTGTSYSNEESVKNLSSGDSITLYAQWKKVPEKDKAYTVPNTAVK